MNEQQTRKVETDRQAILDAKQKGVLTTAKTYMRLSGPGWLQSALTLGGGSLASSLYLGVLTGFAFLWLQPLAMILGIVMLSAIGYIALSTPQRPFQAINQHISPVLGWAWAIATLLANMVFAMPQYALASGVLRQNLLPGLLGPNGLTGDFGGKLIVSVSILAVTLMVTWTYGSGSRGIKIYELMLKIMVGVIVACFIGVVVMIALQGNLAWKEVFRGFIPDLSMIWKPAEGFDRLLTEVPPQFRDFWTNYIIHEQRQVMISAASAAVGINMTFLLPYSMIRRGWDRNFRGLAIFDLATCMFIPYVLATSCVIIASANRFHPGPVDATTPVVAESASEMPVLPEKVVHKFMIGRLQADIGEEAFAKLSEDEIEQKLQLFGTEFPFPPLNSAEVQLASHLQRRDAFDLARSLKPLTGPVVANVIFGIGVVGMTLSTITLLMVISGFVICEMLGFSWTGWPYRLSTLAAATGVFGPFLWAGEARFWLIIPASIFGMMLLPIAYLTFFFMMNSKKILGQNRPKGTKRIAWNIGMSVAVLVTTVASIYSLWTKAGIYGLSVMAVLLLSALIVHFVKSR